MPEAVPVAEPAKLSQKKAELAPGPGQKGHADEIQDQVVEVEEEPWLPGEAGHGDVPTLADLKGCGCEELPEVVSEVPGISTAETVVMCLAGLADHGPTYSRNGLAA